MKTRVLFTAAFALLAVGSTAFAQVCRPSGMPASHTMPAKVQRVAYSVQPVAMRSRGGCDCVQPSCAAPPVCGCDASCEARCVPCAPRCFPLRSLMADIDRVLNRIFACDCPSGCGGLLCCDAGGCEAPVCGCDVPVCGCEVPVCGCEAPVRGCDVPVACGCAVPGCETPARYDVLPRRPAPIIPPDPFLDEDVPPAPPIPTEARRKSPVDRQAVDSRASNDYFAQQVRATAIKRRGSTNDVTEAPHRSVLKPVGHAVQSVTPRDLPVTAAEPIEQPKVQSKVDPSVRPISGQMELQRQVPHNPLR